CQAQFLDSFNSEEIEGWFFFTGDGAATMDFVQKDGYARILVDATKDKYNVWWAVTKRDVSDFLDLNKLKNASYQLRVEAKVRVGNAPRRINMMVNTQRTTNYHIDLMEFDIPDTSEWHIVSMTTKKFDAVPGDNVYVQLNVTDWGLGKYHVDVDYYRADIVNVDSAGPDKGELVPYHPPIPPVNTFLNHLDVTHDCLINSDFPDVNFNDWHIQGQEDRARVLTVSANHWAILRWDFEKYKNVKIDGAGLLELTTYSVAKGGNYIETFGEDFGMEFDKVRVIEIVGGDPAWDQNTVTYNNLIRGKSYADVFNTQMIYDLEVNDKPGSKNFITISKPVLQRLVDGKTKGLLIRPLGAIDASFYASENRMGNSPKLHFNVIR
ncbi:MAG: hypothetical protein P8Z50_05060, partial [candidate division WOR-3 bacterium]